MKKPGTHLHYAISKHACSHGIITDFVAVESQLRTLFDEGNNAVDNATIACHPNLFAIVSPINVDVFESLLSLDPK